MTHTHVEPAANNRPPSVDPAVAALIDLEQRTGLRRAQHLSHAPLAALRELEQRTGTAPYVFGQAPTDQQEANR